jgi:hypothetical protein
MGNKFASIIALICILVYVAALAIGASQIYTSVKERRMLAEREISVLADIAASSEGSAFLGTSSQEAIREGIRNSRTLEGIIVSGPQNRETAFERETGGAIVWINNVPQFKTRFGLSRNPQFRSVAVPGLRNISMQGVFSCIEYGELIAVLKRTLFAVLAALALAFLALILELTFPKNGGAAAPAFAPEKRKPQGRKDKAPEAETPPPDTGSVEEENREEVSFFDETAFPISSLAIPKEDESPAPLIPGEEYLETPEPAPEDPGLSGEVPPELPEAGEAQPRGLYSPHGNIGWEAYTKERLEAELHRCASFDQDLVLIAMEFKEMFDNEVYSAFTAAAVRFFNLRDLIFERGRQGISVIIPNVDLEEGFFKSEEFHNRILSTMSASFTTNTDLCIGLSSRSGRLIDADRLIMEASQALERALSDPVSPIVAFKSDPEKYRAFIASQNKSRP